VINGHEHPLSCAFFICAVRGSTRIITYNRSIRYIKRSLKRARVGSVNILYIMDARYYI
jgi:hypothetical protein